MTTTQLGRLGIRLVIGADMPQDVLVQITDGVELVTLNRPGKLNALRASTFAELEAAWQAAVLPDVRAVVITGSGRGFCAGVDLSVPLDLSQSRSDRLKKVYHPHVLALVALEKPVIAAVNGPAVGAGISLACAAMARIASTAAVFKPGFSAIGVAPDCGGSWLIPKVLGYHRAVTWMSGNTALDAATALAWRLVDRVVPAEELLDEALSLAAQLADTPGSAVKHTMRLMREAAWGSNYLAALAAHLDREAETLEVTASDPGRQAAITRMRKRMGSL